MQIASSADVSLALEVREALSNCDYATYFALYNAAPNLGRAILDKQVDDVRFTALKMLIASFKPSVPVALLAKVLGFAPAAKYAGNTVKTPQSIPLPGCMSAAYAGKAAAVSGVQEANAACFAWLQSYGAVLTLAADGRRCLLLSREFIVACDVHVVSATDSMLYSHMSARRAPSATLLCNVLTCWRHR